MLGRGHSHGNLILSIRFRQRVLPLVDELNKNQIKQVDWAANGADVTVTRTVWRNGSVYFQDNISTHYEPWQAVCEYGPDSKNPEKLAKENNLCRNPSS